MLTSLFTVIMILFNSCGQAQDNSSDGKIISMLKEFYTSYITENSKMPPNMKNIDSMKRKYCTNSLLYKIKKQELDYDPFLNAQDSNTEWLKTLSITKDSNKTNLYIVSYIDSYSNNKISVKLIIVKEKDSFKINSIL